MGEKIQQPEKFVQKVKAPNPRELLSLDAPVILRNQFGVEHLANVYRSGWLLPGRDIAPDKCESVAEHKHGMLQLAKSVKQLYGEYFSSIDWLKVYEIILDHDKPEEISGDIPPGVNVPKEERKELERNAMMKISDGNSLLQDDIEHWDEFEGNTTEEAKFVHDLDYFQRAMKAYIYGKQNNKDLSAFWSDFETKLRSPIFVTLAKYLFEGGK